MNTIEEKRLRQFRDDFWAHNFVRQRRSEVSRDAHPCNGVKSRMVWWIVGDKDGWCRPCWVYFSYYSTGCVRIRNDVNRADFPRTQWPWELPPYGGINQFELTFHESEMGKETWDLIYGACSIRGFEFKSPMFNVADASVPPYAWTIKGEKYHKAESSPSRKA